MHKHLLIGLSAAAAIVGAGAANATNVTFTTTGNTATSGTITAATSAHSYTSKVDGTTYSMRASAFSFNGLFVETDWLGQYSQGLGVTSWGDGTGAGNEHTIDNHGSIDFVMLQFDRPVDLVSASLYAGYPIGGTPDNDATISFATVTQGWSTTLDMNNPSLLATLLGNAWTVDGTGHPVNGSYVTALNPADHVGNLWLIGAPIINCDHIIDSFKLNSITVTPAAGAVPEPATWATMIAGFGLTGAALRRRRSTAAAIA